MKNETILITGSAGFIGTHLVRKLVNLNFTIVCFDIFFSDSFISEFNSKVIIQKGNLNDKSILKKINQKYSFSFVFHLAGSKSRTNNIIEFKESFEINYFGTLNLLNTLINNKKHIQYTKTLALKQKEQTSLLEDTRRRKTHFL